MDRVPFLPLVFVLIGVGCAPLPKFDPNDEASVAYYENLAGGLGQTATALYGINADPDQAAKGAKILGVAENLLTVPGATPDQLRQKYDAAVMQFESDPKKQAKFIRAGAAVEGGIIVWMGGQPVPTLPKSLEAWRRLSLAAVRGARRGLGLQPAADRLHENGVRNVALNQRV